MTAQPVSLRFALPQNRTRYPAGAEALSLEWLNPAENVRAGATLKCHDQRLLKRTSELIFHQINYTRFSILTGLVRT